MRTLSPALLQHLLAGTQTLATCLEITCTNGRVLRLTDHTEPIGLYQPGLLFRPMVWESTGSTQVDNTECECLTGPDLTRADIEAGLLTDATVRSKLVNYASPSDGDLATRLGYVGSVKTDLSGLKFVLEIVGLTDKLAGTITEQYTQTCRATLGDERCTFNTASIAVSGTVEGVSADGTTITDSTRTEAASWFAFGLVTFTSGASAGFSREVIASNTGSFVLVQQMPRPVAPGDNYTLVPGCNRRRETCVSKFSNILFFRGEPFVPDPTQTFYPIG